MNDETLIAVLGQQIRVDIRWGTGIPLVLCNGIGASLEVLNPFVAQLDPDTTVVRFDVPGSGASPDSPFPYRFPYLAAVLGTLLKKVGIIDRRAGSSQVDVLGLSWGSGSPSNSPFRTRAGAADSSSYPQVPVR
jgi:pimeloyl-ACP methyl ester carboxylesterase